MSNYPPGVTGNEPQIAGASFPRGTEDWMGVVIFMPGSWEPGDDPLDYEDGWEFGVIESFDVSEDADEDGRYMCVSLEVRSLTDGRRDWVDQDKADEYLVPDGPLKRAAEAWEKADEAKSARRQAERCAPYIRHELRAAAQGA